MTKPHSPDTLLLQSSQARNSSPKHENVDEFVSSSGLEKCVSAMDALQWMGAVRMRVNGCSAVNGCRQNESPNKMQQRKCSYGLWTMVFELKMLDLFQPLSSPDVNWWTAVMFLSDSHSDGTHSLQSIHWLSFWRHPFTAEHPLTLILTAPIHCRASIDSHSDGTHSLQSIHWLSFWRHPFTAEHPLLRHISPNLMKTQTHPNLEWWLIEGWACFHL